MNGLRYTLQQCETLFQGYFRVIRLHLTHAGFRGGTIGPFTRELLERGYAAAVLPYDPLTDHVLLIEQFRPAPVANHDPEPWLLEIIAGIIESGEAPEQVARREAQEEANCTLTDIVLLHECYISQRNLRLVCWPRQSGSSQRSFWRERRA
jgi:ADP-ribose pyrophosphatase